MGFFDLFRKLFGWLSSQPGSAAGGPLCGTVTTATPFGGTVALATLGGTVSTETPFGGTITVRACCGC